MQKVVRKFNLGDEPNDLAFWLTQSPMQRLYALESIRDFSIKLIHNGTKPGFQRIYTVIKRS